jgi:hypothetical protein
MKNATIGPLAWANGEWNPIYRHPHATCCALFLARLRISQLGRWRRPMRLLVGGNDLFGTGIPDDAIRDIYRTMMDYPAHTFLVVTKNAFRMEQWFGSWAGTELQEWAMDQDIDWPPQNIHLGIVAHDQDTLDDRLGALIASPARSRFVVFYKVHSRINLMDVECPRGYGPEFTRSCEICQGSLSVCYNGVYNALKQGIDEVVLLRARGPDDLLQLQLELDLTEQCRQHNVPIYHL